MIKDNNMMKLRQIIWRTTLSKKVEEFATILNDNEIFKKYFDEKYVEKLTDKSKTINRTVIKLGILYTILMLSLFASQNIGDSEFELFGYGFKNLSNYKEFLLLFACIISPISAILVAYKKYIDLLVKECLKKFAPDENIRKFYSHAVIDEYFEGLLYKESKNGFRRRHGFSVFIMFIFAFITILLFLSLIAGSFFIQINVIFDVIQNPSTSYYINFFIVSISIISILFSWIVSIMQLPMPEVDISNYAKLSEIEANDPEKYQDIMRKMAKDNAKKNEVSTLILSVIVYIVTFTAISIFFFPDNMDNLSIFLGKAMTGFFVTIILSTGIIKFSTKNVWAWFFKKYKNKDQQLRLFGRVKIFWLLVKILLPFSIAVIYSYYIYTFFNQ